MLNSLAKDEQPQNAMEVGPGCGVYLPVLCDLCEKVTAIDVEDAFLDQARTVASRHANLSVRRDDVTHSMQPDHSYDLILCTEVIEHLTDSQPALRDMFRLLKPGGRLVLTTPQRYSFLELACRVAFLPGVINLARMVYREPVLKTGHINLLTDGQVLDQATAAGFKVQRQFKTGLYLPLIAEFTGKLGMRIEQWLEAAIRETALDNVLWTQCYVLYKPYQIGTARSRFAKAA